MAILVYRWVNDANSMSSTESSETPSLPTRTKPRDGTPSSRSAESSRSSSSTSTPAWTTTPMERGLTLRWEFETRETAHRWSELMRDMVPCAVKTWDSLPGWETRWSVSVHSRAAPSKLSSPEVFLVELRLSPVPHSDVAL